MGNQGSAIKNRKLSVKMSLAQLEIIKPPQPEKERESPDDLALMPMYTAPEFDSERVYSDLL